MSEIIIIAPHCDDEIIGCYSIINKEDTKPIIIYTEETTSDRQEEAMKLKAFRSVKAQMFCKSIAPQYMRFNNIFYFPGPEEIHPAHRKMAAIGEEMARNGFDVIFYSTNMNVPHIREVKNPFDKRNLLNNVYPGQSDLWKYEHKFWMFEAFQKWIF